MRYSSALRNIVWWCLYLVAAVWLQARLPGVDAMLPGLIIAMQEKLWRQTAWVTLFCLLIQESTGSLAFGGGVLWYSFLFIYFQIGQSFFVTTSLVFIVLLSAAMGATLAAILLLLSLLQNIALFPPLLFEQAMVQALLIPPLWGVAYLTRKRFFRHED